MKAHVYFYMSKALVFRSCGYFGCIISIFFLLSSLAACKKAEDGDSLSSLANNEAIFSEKALVFTGSSMGTGYTVKISNYDSRLKRSQAFVESLEGKIRVLLENFNQQFSTYIPSSTISLLNTFFSELPRDQRRAYPIDAAFGRQLKAALFFSRITDGSFDVSVSPLINLWGFGSKTADEVSALPNKAALDAVRKQIGYQRMYLREAFYDDDDDDNDDDDEIEIGSKAFNNQYIMSSKAYLLFMDGGMELNFSAIAKGRAVDEVALLLELYGIENYLVEIGGEIRVLGRNEDGNLWRLLVALPPDAAADADNIVLELDKGAVATSGDYNNFYERNGKRYSHIIDPKTGYPIEHKLASATVIAGNCESADALATAFMVMGEDKAKSFAELNKLAVSFLYREPSKPSKTGNWTTYQSKAFQSYSQERP